MGFGEGRLARWLTEHLSEQGAYDGFDVNAKTVAWCQENITARFPNFRFTHVDVFNGAYNPTGAVRPSEFVFPYEDGRFDVVCLFSVFTHMLPADMEHYFSEIRRVLKRGGRVFATYLLLTADSLGSLVAAKDLEHAQIARSILENDFGSYRSGSEVPEWIVAYDEAHVLDLYRRFGFTVEEPILYGNWPKWAISGEWTADLYQDGILALSVDQ